MRRAEEFTNALVARGYAFSGEASKVKRADYVLTHYSFNPLDGAITTAITVLLAAILILHFGYGYMGMENSFLIRWLQSAL